MTLSSKSVKGHKKRMDYGLLSGVGTLGNWNVILKIIRKTVYLSDVGIRFKKNYLFLVVAVQTTHAI